MDWHNVFEDFHTGVSSKRYLKDFLKSLTPKQRKCLSGVLDRDVEKAKISEAKIEAYKINRSGIEAQCKYLERQGYGRIVDALYETLEKAGLA
jgi:hypothetical protein